jgi:hypothetical protein
MGMAVTDKFKVADLAAAKKKRAPRKQKNGPVVTVVKAHSGAVMLAHAMAGDRDVHLEVQRDGSIVIKNGARK